MVERIGIYPGTFDPLHAGHISFAIEAIAVCNLDKVVFLPEHAPRDKPHASPAIQRVTDLSVALSPIPSLEFLDLSSEPFTVSETLPELQRLFGGAELVLLVGSDVACSSLQDWPHVASLLRQVQLVIGLRTTDTQEKVCSVINAIDEANSIRTTYTIISTSHAHVASSHIRENNL